jgi:hypothetical protein
MEASTSMEDGLPTQSKSESVKDTLDASVELVRGLMKKAMLELSTFQLNEETEKSGVAPLAT